MSWQPTQSTPWKSTLTPVRVAKECLPGHECGAPSSSHGLRPSPGPMVACRSQIGTQTAVHGGSKTTGPLCATECAHVARTRTCLSRAACRFWGPNTQIKAANVELVDGRFWVVQVCRSTKRWAVMDSGGIFSSPHPFFELQSLAPRRGSLATNVELHLQAMASGLPLASDQPRVHGHQPPPTNILRGTPRRRIHMCLHPNLPRSKHSHGEAQPLRKQPQRFLCHVLLLPSTHP